MKRILFVASFVAVMALVTWLVPPSAPSAQAAGESVACTNFVVSVAANTTNATMVLPARDGSRSLVRITNNGTDGVYFAWGASSLTNNSALVTGGGALNESHPSVPQQALYMRSATASPVVVGVVECRSTP
jgi:hypothetical protein